MTQFVVPGALGSTDAGSRFFRRADDSASQNRRDFVGQGRNPGPVGRKHESRTPRHPQNNSRSLPQTAIRRDVTQLSQEAQLQSVADVVMKCVQEMNDVCTDCSATSFGQMQVTISPLRAEQDGFSTTTYAAYLADTNTAVIYQQFFQLHFVMQASVLFHEYLHSLPENLAMVRNATDEERQRPHAQRPWESSVIILERIFQERFGQRIANDKK